MSSNHTFPMHGFLNHEEVCKIEGRFAPDTDTSPVCSMPILQDASVATPVSSPSRQSLRRVAESLERCESSACTHATDRFDQPTPQWDREIQPDVVLCSSSERPLPSSIACCLCGKKHPDKRGSGPFCSKTLATWLLVSCAVWPKVSVQNTRARMVMRLEL